MGHPEAIGRYQIVGQLATGGMAEILLGKLLGPSGFERAVVIKRILPHLASQEQFREMFLAEARTLAKLRHPNVVQVHELGQDGDELFLVLEYLDGESAYGLMRRLLRAGETLPYSLGMHIVAEAAGGLHAAHELTDDDGRPLGLVHRDVSPQNIHVLYNGQVKLLDFGIAKATDSTVRTEAGHVKGKFRYMSPEQCRGDHLDLRSDIFSLGIVLYELTTARRLFARKNDLMTMKAITEERIVRPSQIAPGYPRRLEEIVMRCLSRLREERFQTAQELRREILALRRELSGDPVPESVLSALMRRAFGDRIAEKKEMLRQIRAGSGVAVVPAAEADPSFDIPIVVDEEAVAAAAPRSTPPIGMDERAPLPPPIEPEPDHSSTKKGMLVGAAAAAVVVGGLLGFQILSAEDEPPPTAALAPEQVHTASVEEDVVAEEDEIPTAPVPAMVEIRVDSVPPGAEVSIAGQPQGETPLTLETEASEEPIVLELTRDGYETYRETVVPDVAQRLRLTLSPERGRPRPRPGSVRPAMMGGGDDTHMGGFRRFD
jgi:hypothetical protein